MHVSDTAESYRSALQREAVALLASAGLPPERVQAVERYEFYERVKKAYAIVVTGELEPWGNFLLRKGVLGQPLRP
jgi:L-fucose mutarotase